MKTTSSIKSVVLGTATIVLATTSSVSAVTVPSVSSVKTSSAACTKLATTITTKQAAMTQKIATMQADFQKRLQTISSNQAAVDQKAATYRSNFAQKFDAAVDKLRQEPQLADTQKKAIDTYHTNVMADEKTREQAVDAARSSYRTAYAAQVTTHQAALTKAATTLQTDILAAFSTAQANCGDGSAVSTLRGSVKKARDTFKSTRTDSAIKTNVEQLAATRNSAVKAADSAFKQQLQAETATLKQTLK